MSIKVRYFASLKDLLGHADTEIDIHGPRSAQQIWASLNPDLALPAGILVAINMDYAGLDSLVKDGDELAFFPPVTGG